ncbi:MAG: hypothetical protein FWH08_03445 [Oscillospiraceae bacterium]|nr:hypothetical protein [Oscillospiraceae bacterium]
MNIQKAYDVARMSHGNQPKPASQETQKKETTLAADNTDKFEPENNTYSQTYNKGANRTDYRGIGNDEGVVNSRASARQLKNDAVRGMVQSQINAQVNKGGYKPLFGGNETVMNAFKAAEASSAKHDDYWSVDATAERIFTFAKTLAGDNDEMFQTMKDAFLKGFRQAEGAWRGAGGGKLPGVSYETRDKVLEMFDQWEQEINAKKDEVTTEKKTEGASSNSQKTSSLFIGYEKFGSTGATAAPTTYSQGKKIAYIGEEKYGKPIEDIDVNGFKNPNVE